MNARKWMKKDVSIRLNQRNRTAGGYSWRDVLEEIGSYGCWGDWINLKSLEQGVGKGRAELLGISWSYSPKAEFLLPQQSLSSALKPFQLIVSGPPKLSRKISFTLFSQLYWDITDNRTVQRTVRISCMQCDESGHMQTPVIPSP